ncbi:hypothetical protein [Glycomyces paridis]|uniref:Uncharacterized protein n=1 Tax=Glycomyces paridis TaxID=2126555 RepID=A0A4S8PEB9_9ACTN|nr:hypothetical protein [Glycomyces paridis]THV28733.1 hypothetical protein E9998_11550 [Glycomyces paridis]
MKVRKHPEFLGGAIFSEADGIRILHGDDAREANTRLLAGLPALNAVEVDWSGLRHRVLADAGASDTSRTEAIGSVLAPVAGSGERILLLWAFDLCVEIDAALLGAHLATVLAAAPGLLIFVPSEAILIDCRPDGEVIAARREP